MNVYELPEAVKHGMETVRPIYVVFDILFLNGVELINLPYEKRIQIRHQLVSAIKTQGMINGLEVREVKTMFTKDNLELIRP